MWEAQQKITACSSNPCSIAIELLVGGVICPSGPAIGNLCTSASADGPSAEFWIVFKMLPSDHDNEYMMIDAPIVRAHQH
jgi:hypothetical protein